MVRERRLPEGPATTWDGLNRPLERLGATLALFGAEVAGIRGYRILIRRFSGSLNCNRKWVWRR